MTQPMSDLAKGLVQTNFAETAWDKAFTGANTDALPQAAPTPSDGSFQKDFFPQYDPTTILQPVEAPPGKEELVDSYVFQGDGKIYDFKKGTPQDEALEKIWDHNSPGLWGSAKGMALYGIPSDFASAISYGLGGVGLEESAKDWRSYSDKVKKDYSDRYQQFMTPSFDAALRQGKVWDFGLHVIGSGIPYMGMALTGAGAGAAGATALGASSQLALGTGAFIGSTGITSPALVAQFADRQVAEMKSRGIEDAEDRIDWYKAAGLGVLAAGLQAVPVESIFLGGPLLGLVQRWGAQTGTSTSARMLAAIADVSGTNALAGAGTQYLSRLNADMPLLDDSAKSEYLEAAIAGSLVGVPFGAGRGLLTHGGPNLGKPRDIDTILNEHTTTDTSALVNTAKDTVGPSMDELIQNPNFDYGIKNIDDAEEFLMKYNYKAQDGTERNGMADFVEMYGRSYKDSQVLDAARRTKRQLMVKDRLDRTSDGVLYPTLDSLPQRHSSDPKILTKAAYLTDRYGYEDSFVKSLTDATLTKLYELNALKDLKKTPNLPENLVQEFAAKIKNLIDEEVIREVEQYGSLYSRPKSIERNQLSVEARRKLISENPRHRLAESLMKTRDMKQAFDEMDRPRREALDKAWDDKFDSRKGPGFIEEPPVDGETFSEYAGMRKLPEGPAGLLEYKPAKTLDKDNLVDIIGEFDKAANAKGVRVQEGLSKEDTAKMIMTSPLFKALRDEYPDLKDMEAVLKRGEKELNKKPEPPKPTKPTERQDFSNKFVNPKVKDEGPGKYSKDTMDELELIRDKFRRAAETRNKELLAKHPGLDVALNNLFKNLVELQAETKVADQPYTKAMQGRGKLLDSLADRLKVTKAIENAFLFLNKNLGTKLAETFDKVLSNQGTVSPKEFTQVTTFLDMAFHFGNATEFRNINEGALQSVYKLIRSALPEKEIKALENNRDFLVKWYKSTKDINVKDLDGLKTVDLEAIAFSDYLKDALVISTKQFKNSRQDRFFGSIETALKRAKNELNNQGYKSVDDLLQYNKAANEEVPPEARRPGVTHRRIVDEVQDKEDQQLLQEQLNSVNRAADEASGNVPKNGFTEPPSNHKGEKMPEPLKNLNNLGSFFHHTAWMRSIPSLARQVPIISEVFNNKLSEKSLANQLQVRFATKADKAFTENGGWQTILDAHEILDRMRITGQKIVRDKDGRILFTDADGTTRVFDHRMTKAIEDTTAIYKEAYLAKDENLREFLSYWADEGLTKDSSLKHIQRVINSYEEKIKDNPYPQLAARFKDQREALSQIHEKLLEIESIVNRDTPYVPYMRFGDYVVSVKDRNTGNLVHMESINEQNKFGSKVALPSEKQKAERVKEFHKRFDPSKYKVEAHQLTYNKIGEYINKGLVSTDLIQSMLASGVNENMRFADHFATGIENPKQFLKDMSRDIENNRFKILKYVAARGAGKFSQKADLIPGYSKDWPRVLEAYLNTHANSIAKQAKMKDWGDIQARVLKEEMPQHIRDKVDRYVDFLNDPGDDYADIRFFNFAMAMGARPASAILQLNTLPQQVFGLGLAYSPNIRNFFDLSSSIAKAAARVTTLGKVGKFSPEVERIIASQPGYFRTGLMEDLLRNKLPLQKGAGDKIRGGIEIVASAFISPAERVTRIATFDFFHSMFKNRPRTIERAIKYRKDDQNWQQFWKNHQREMDVETAMSIYSMLETHGVYGKEGRGELQRGLFGSVLFPFTTYAQQMLEVLGAQLSGKFGAAGVATGLWVMGTYVGLAGLAGIPAYELWKTLYEEYQKKVNNRITDLEMELVEADMPLWLRKGLLSSTTGLDLSNRIGQQVIGQNLLVGALKGEFKLNEVGGVPGRTLQGILDGAAELANPTSTKSPMDLIQGIAPGVIQDLIRSQKLLNNPEDELKTSSGKMLRDPLSVDSGDITARMFGFNTMENVQAREKLYWQQKANQEFNQARSRFAEGVATARYKMVLAARKGDPQLSEDARAELNRLQKEMLGFIEKNKIKMDWRSFNNNVKERIRQKLNPGLIRKPTEGEKRHMDALIDRGE